MSLWGDLPGAAAHRMGLATGLLSVAPLGLGEGREGGTARMEDGRGEGVAAGGGWGGIKSKVQSRDPRLGLRLEETGGGEPVGASAAVGRFAWQRCARVFRAGAENGARGGRGPPAKVGTVRMQAEQRCGDWLRYKHLDKVFLKSPKSKVQSRGRWPGQTGWRW